MGSAGSSTRQKRKRVQSPLAPCEPPTASDSSVSLSPSSPLLERVLPGEVEAEESMEGRNMVVAAFNLPISLRKEGEEWKVSWNSERDVFRNFEALRGTMNVKFVGCPPEFVPLEDREAVEDALNEFDCFPVFLEKDVHERFFSGFCKGVLWPLFHYFTPSLRPGFAKKWDSLWQTYNSVNMIVRTKTPVSTD